jgi:hypothetical protein
MGGESPVPACTGLEVVRIDDDGDIGFRLKKIQMQIQNPRWGFEAGCRKSVCLRMTMSFLPYSRLLQDHLQHLQQRPPTKYSNRKKREEKKALTCTDRQRLVINIDLRVV